MSAPFTIAHFKAWALGLTLDSGDPWKVELFQRDFIGDVFKGFKEAWLVVPEENGKSTLVAGLALYYLEHVPQAAIPVAAATREQAESIYAQAEGFVLRSERMHELVPDRIRVARGKRAMDVPRFICQNGNRRINHFEGGRLQVRAADDRTGDGIIPAGICVIDELHRHRDLKLYRTWRGKLDKRGAQLVAISTAGDPGSEFEEARSRILRNAASSEERGARIRAEGPGVVLHDWAVRKRSHSEDLNIVAAANPRKAITVASLKVKRESPTMTPEHWQRFVCNLATRTEASAVAPELWDSLAEADLEPDRSAPAFGWLDLAWVADTTALGLLVWESPERRVITGVRILEPPVDEADVVAALLDLQEEFLPKGWVYDPNAGGRQMAQLLEKGDHPQQIARGTGPMVFIEHSQANSAMARASSLFDEAVRAGWVVHDGDPALRRHVMNAVRRPVPGEQFRFDRPTDVGRSTRRPPIDALTGVLMGHDVAAAELTSSKEPMAAWV